MERPSASAGERTAAELLAGELEERGARVELEEERVHGTYWWPVGLLCAAAALAGLTTRRGAALVAGLAAWAAMDDVSGAGRQRFRRLLPSRTTVNVVAEAGDPAAERTVVFVAHHDAAHSGLVFHPDLARAFGRRFPKLLERSFTTPPTMWGSVWGPVAVALGLLLERPRLRRAGRNVCMGYAAAMADIGSRRSVPAANDNATGMAVLVALAGALRREPLPGVRVLLVSTGSEESFMEGMRAFAERHFPELPRERTTFVCVDTLGSPDLLALEAEGMLRLRPYPRDLIELVHECAGGLGIFVHRRLRFRNATDGVIALIGGYPTITLGSVDEFKVPTDYHWPTDVPENVDYGTLEDGARLCWAILNRLAPGTIAAR